MQFRNDRSPDATVSAQQPDGSDQRSGPERFAYINAVRGWAILMVITTHVGGRFAELPFPVRKLTNFGWHGVQLFFLASAVTLALSWHASAQPFGQKSMAFFVRRFLRIAPMYYLGAALFTCVDPPESGIDFAQLARSLLFVNTWSPDWIPTTGGWMVVPGGWSIGVEFTFYALFPALIVSLTTLRRAMWFSVVSIILAAAASRAGELLFARYPDVALTNFLYFWFPNQLPVFAIGLVLYHLIIRTANNRLPRAVSAASFCVIGVAAIALAEHPMMSARFIWSFTLPQVLAATLVGAAFVLTLARTRPGWLTNPMVQRFGELSFSGYVLHFLFVGHIPEWTGGLIDVHAGGYRAIVMVVLLWVLVVPATFLCSEVTYRCVEQPGMNLARRLTRRKATRLVPAM